MSALPHARVPLALASIGLLACAAAPLASASTSDGVPAVTVEIAAPAGTTELWVDVEAASADPGAVRVILAGPTPTELDAATTAFGRTAITAGGVGDVEFALASSVAQSAEVSLTAVDSDGVILEARTTRVTFTANPSTDPEDIVDDGEPAPSPGPSSPPRGRDDGGGGGLARSGVDPLPLALLGGSLIAAGAVVATRLRRRTSGENA